MEVILMVGIAGSGKTTLSKIAFPDHIHVSLDVLKTILPLEKVNILARHKNLSCCTGLSNNRKRECVLLHEALNACKNIVIDDTNLTKETRARHISTSHEYGAVVRTVHFTNVSQAFDYNRKRMRRLDDSVLYGQRDKKSVPTKKEGFEYIQQMPGWFYYIGGMGNFVGKMARASQC